MVNSTIFTIAFVCIIAIILWNANSQNGNMLIASAENTETMQEKEKQNSLKALTTVTARTPNTDNFDYAPSLDGEQVPVPKGYVASSVEDEMYVNGVSGTWKLQEDLTLASPEGETYPWTQVTASGNSNGAWASGNYKVASSTSTIETNSFTVSENAVVRINWSVCCQEYKTTDYAYYTIINTGTGASIGGTGSQEARISGYAYGTAEASLVYVDKDIKLEAGTYKVEVKYTKNGSVDTNLDKAYVKSIGVYTKSGTGSEITVREHTGGFVIYEGTEAVTNDNVATAKTTRNQYVWVPISSSELTNMYHATNGVLYANQYDFTASGYSKVSNKSLEPQVLSDKGYDRDNNYLKKYLEGISITEFLQEMRDEFYEMLQSIATYKGFYIGRYETGNINQKIPCVVKENSNISDVNWYLMYRRSKNLKGASKAVQTGMIWGIQWDETLKWLIDAGEKNNVEVGADSTAWGNYSNSITSGAGSKRETGYSETWKANNIYDLAGNVHEWTMQSYGSYCRYLRGGYFGYNGIISPAQYRLNYRPTYGRSDYGVRGTLYLL